MENKILKLENECTFEKTLEWNHPSH